MTLYYTLLDVLAAKLNVNYLSDLKYLNQAQEGQLLCLLLRADAEATPLQEWNEALAYLADLPSAETCDDARNRLIVWLQEKQTHKT